MTHALAAYFGAGHFNTTLITNNTFKAHALVLTAITLPVLGWSKDAFAEETIFLGLECTIVNCFRLCYLTIAPTANLLWTGEADTDSVKIIYFEHATSPG